MSVKPGHKKMEECFLINSTMKVLLPHLLLYGDVLIAATNGFLMAIVSLFTITIIQKSWSIHIVLYQNLINRLT